MVRLRSKCVGRRETATTLEIGMVAGLAFRLPAPAGQLLVELRGSGFKARGQAEVVHVIPLRVGDWQMRRHDSERHAHGLSMAESLALCGLPESGLLSLRGMRGQTMLGSHKEARHGI